MDDRCAVPGDQSDPLARDVHRVYRDEVGAEQPEAAQALERPHAVLGEGALDLVGRLMHVYVDWDVEFAGDCRNLAEAGIRHRVRGVRRKAEAEQRIALWRSRSSRPWQVIVDRRGSARKIEDDDAERRAHADANAASSAASGKKYISLKQVMPPRSIRAGKQRAVAHEVRRKWRVSNGQMCS